MPRIRDTQPVAGRAATETLVDTTSHATGTEPQRSTAHASYFEKLRHSFDDVLSGARTMTQAERDRLANAGLTGDAVAFLALQDMVDPQGRHGLKVDGEEIGDFVRLVVDASAGRARGMVDARAQVKALIAAADAGELQLRPEARRLAEKFARGDLHPVRHHGFFAGNALDAMRVLATGLEFAIKPTSLAGKLLSAEEAAVLVGMAKQLPRALQTVLRDSWAETIEHGDALADAAGLPIIEDYVEGPLTPPPAPATPVDDIPAHVARSPIHEKARVFLTALFQSRDLDTAFSQMSDYLFVEDGVIKESSEVRDTMRRAFADASSNHDVTMALTEPESLSLVAARRRFGPSRVDRAVRALEREGIGSDAYHLVAVGVQIAGFGAAGDYLVLVSRAPGEESVIGLISQ